MTRRVGIAQYTIAYGALALCFLALLTSDSQAAYILPIGDEPDSWSDLTFPASMGVNYNSTTDAFSLSSTQFSQLEIGAEFGPSNPGIHYGNNTGTLGSLFQVTLTVSGVTIGQNLTPGEAQHGVVAPGGSGTVKVVLNGFAPGSVGTDYGVLSGATLLQGKVLEAMLDAQGSDTLDILFSIDNTGALQNPTPSFGSLPIKFAPNGSGILRISGATFPNDWSTGFSVSARLDLLGVPEPGALMLMLLGGMCTALARSRRR